MNKTAQSLANLHKETRIQMENLTEKQIRKLEALELETIHYRQTGRGREFLFKAIRDAIHALSTKYPDSIHG